MSWGAQNRSEDAKTRSAACALSETPELDLWPVQQYVVLLVFMLAIGSNKKQTRASEISDCNRWFLLGRDFGCFYCAYLGHNTLSHLEPKEIRSRAAVIS
jgi:hypothetical protein